MTRERLSTDLAAVPPASAPSIAVPRSATAPSVQAPAISAPVALAEPTTVPSTAVPPAQAEPAAAPALRSALIPPPPLPERSRWRPPRRRNEVTSASFAAPIELQLLPFWRWWTVALALLTPLGVPRPSHAQAPDPTAALHCGGLMLPQHPKFVLYPDLAWAAGPPLRVDIERSDALPLPDAVLLDALAHAVDRWNAQLCGGVAFEAGSFVPTLAPDVPAPDRTVRVVMSAESLQTTSGRVLYGYTAHRFDAERYASAMIVLNTFDYTWQTDGCGDGPDLVGVLVHELGHALGLDHSDDPRAVMRGSADPDETWQLRWLRADDRDALNARFACERPPTTPDAPAASSCAPCTGSPCSAEEFCGSLPPRADGEAVGELVCLAACNGDPDSCDADQTCRLVQGGSTCEPRCVPEAGLCRSTAADVGVPSDAGADAGGAGDPSDAGDEPGCAAVSGSPVAGSGAGGRPALWLWAVLAAALTGPGFKRRGWGIRRPGASSSSTAPPG